MTNLELKNNIDLNITNKTQSSSITPVNVGSEMKNVVDYIDQEIANIELLEGPTGPAGVDGIDGVNGTNGTNGGIGPQGVPGPVGPAGLNWQGVWVSGTSYVVDDAVGYNGASWFCVNATSGTISPNLDPTKWALLAAQGSPGAQGAQGIQGIQGPAGTNGIDGAVGATGPQGPIGLTGPQGPQGIQGVAGGAPAVKTTETLTSTASSAPFPYSTADFAQFPSTFSYALPPTPALGEVRYIKTAFANCTLWSSPNPGNDGAYNNFYTPNGNGNSSMSLVAGKSYRFTYIGRYGATYGYWTVEIMNNI